MNIMGTATSDA